MGKKVLIVDDEKSISDILDYNLKKDGYETCCAYDGPSALDLARAENPDLILLGGDIFDDDLPRRRRTRSSAWRTARTTTSRSRFPCASCSRA